MRLLWRLPRTTRSNVLGHIQQVDDFVAQLCKRFEKCVNSINSGNEILEMVERNSHLHNGIIHMNIQFVSQLLDRNECSRETQARAAAIKDLTSIIEDCSSIENFSRQEDKEFLIS